MGLREDEPCASQASPARQSGVRAMAAKGNKCHDQPPCGWLYEGTIPRLCTQGVPKRFVPRERGRRGRLEAAAKAAAGAPEEGRQDP